jgi:hypothetical protein
MLDEKLSFAAKGCALVTTSHLAMPGRAGSDSVPVNDPAKAGSFVCGIKSPEKYNRTITGDSASIFPLLATNPAKYQIVEFDQLRPGQPPGSIRTTCRQVQMSCRSGPRDP